MPITTIYIHHSAIKQDGTKQFWKINEYHKSKWNFPSSMGYFGGYNYLCEQDGELRQYRTDGEETAAQKGENLTALSICLAGDFMRDMPTQAQIGTLQGFLADKMRTYGLTRQQVKAHSESKLAQTLCPGDNLQKWIEAYRKPNTIQQQIDIILKVVAFLREQLKRLTK